MAPKTSILVLLASAITMISAAPVADIESRQEPATVNFTPYSGPCEMSTGPNPPQPVSYNLTASTGCITPPYSFTSYVESANTAATSGSCALSIYSGTHCTGTASAGVLTSFGECVFANGQSVHFTCTA